MDVKFALGTEVWHVVNGKIVNGYVESYGVDCEGLWFEIAPAVPGFNYRQGKDVYARKSDAEASLQPKEEEKPAPETSGEVEGASIN